MKEHDHLWQTAEWWFREEARKEAAAKLARYQDWLGLKKYLATAGFRALGDPRAVDVLIALQEVQTNGKNLWSAGTGEEID